MTLKRYKGEYVILWPEYFDSTLSRKYGRKVPKELAVPRPTQRELLETASLLGLKAEPLEGSYPRTWWIKEGPILVEKKGSKRKVILEVAKVLRMKRYR